MKKVLLGTTTLIGAVALASVASAATPKVTLGGFVDFQAGIMNDDLDSDHPGIANTQGPAGTSADSMRNHAFRNDTEISVKVDGKSDSGLGYGGEVWLEADTTNDINNQGTNASKTFVYLEGMWGRFEGGSNVGPDQTMKVDASTIARATGGIDGSWYYFANAATIYLARPDLPMNFGLTGGNASSAVTGFLGDESQENLTKLTYYTPRWNGLQLGVSYAPSDQQSGQNITAANRVDNTPAITVGANTDTITVAQADGIWQGGISWEGNWDQFGFALAATGEMGNSEINTYEDLRAWQVGGSLSFMGFSVAGSYGDWGDSLRLKTGNFDDNHYWTVGGAYENGPFGVSVTYMKSNIEQTATRDNEFKNLVVGVDYKMAPGFTPYLEASFYDQDAFTATNDNDGSVFIAGTLLSF